MDLQVDIQDLGLVNQVGDHKGEKSKRGNSKFDRFGNIDRDMEGYHGDSMEDEVLLGDHLNAGEGALHGSFVTPIAAFHPEIGLVQVGPDAAGPALVTTVSTQVSYDNMDKKGGERTF